MRDISDRVGRERKLERQNEQLEQFASIVSHDLRDPLQAAKATLAVARAEHDREAFSELAEIHDRMEALIEDVLQLAKEGQAVGETSAVDVGTVANDAWTTAGQSDATLVVADDLSLEADRERLRTLFENLFRNAREHGGGDVTVTVGTVEDGNGFVVSDDGPGFETDDFDQVFEHGYTTNEGGPGSG